MSGFDDKGGGKKGPPTLRTIGEEDTKPKLGRSGASVFFDPKDLKFPDLKDLKDETEKITEDLEVPTAAPSTAPTIGTPRGPTPSPTAAPTVADAPPPEAARRRVIIHGMLNKKPPVSKAQQDLGKKAGEKLDNDLKKLFPDPPPRKLSI